MQVIDELKISDLIAEIYSEKYFWQGYRSGDTDIKHQARKCEQAALVLIVLSKVLEGKEIFENKDEAIKFLDEHVIELAKTYNGGLTGSLRLDIIPRLFKNNIEDSN